MLQHTICFYIEAGTLRGPTLSLECRHFFEMTMLFLRLFYMLQHTICFYTGAGTLKGPSLSLECRHVCVHSMPALDLTTLNFDLPSLLAEKWGLSYEIAVL